MRFRSHDIFFVMLFSFVFSNIGFAQKEVSNWYFGTRAGIRIEADTVIVLLDGQTDYIGSTSSYSDISGNLLLYTDGDYVYNRQHGKMPNGIDLRGNPTSSIQNSFIAPNPGNPNLFYIFCTNVTTGIIYDDRRFSYSTVDLTLDGGLGDVVEKSKPLAYPIASVLAAVRHANGSDIWVVTHEIGTNKYLSFLITSSGVQEVPIVSTIGSVYNSYNIKQMKISPDGTMLALTSGDDGLNNRLEVFHFNDETGHIFDPILYIDNTYNYLGSFRNLTGVEFSPNSRFLYATNWDSSGSDNLFQFDLEAGSESEILNSVTIVGGSYYGIQMCMQLGPDGMIYIVHGGGGNWDYLSRIERPNMKGLDSKHEQLRIYLGGREVLLYTPIFISTFFKEPASIEAYPICISDSVKFTILSTGPFDSLRWNFGDPSSSEITTTVKRKGAHFYSGAGTYMVSAEIYRQGSLAETVTRQITLNSLPSSSLVKDSTICQGTILALSVEEGYDYAWSTGSVSNEIHVIHSGEYKVSINNGQCIFKDSIEVKVIPMPVLELPPVITSCEPVVVLNAGNETVNYHMQWSSGQSTHYIEVAESGEYSVVLRNEKCVISDTVAVHLLGVKNIEASATPDVAKYQEHIIFSASASDALAWLWDFGDGNFSSAQTSNHQYSLAGTYTATILVTNQWGCQDSVALVVTVEPHLFIPNIFTPNNDGKNDTFEIQYNGEEDYHLKIFNRWGKLIFYTRNRDEFWDGYGQGSGIYYYHLSIPTQHYTGWVSLVR